MKIAIPTYGRNLTAHFGHCESFAIIDADGNTVLIVYGNTWQGSFVGGRFYKFVMSMNPTIYDVSWYHFKWIDSDADDFADVNEVNTTPVASE